jgi:phospholipid-binding lipoprotein MlaA
MKFASSAGSAWRLARCVSIGLCVLGVCLVAPPGLAAEAGRERPEQRSEVDPWEGFNRPVARFNHVLDRWMVRPLAETYDRFMPEVLRLMVGNVLSNLTEPYVALNNVLQGKPRDAVSDLARFALNSTLGFLGVADLASDIGLPKHREDFGQTLGVWGVPPGPYLVLPFLGPSTLRDGAGTGVDIWSGLTRRVDEVPVRNSLSGFDFLEVRARLLPAQRVLDDALDPYLLMRDGYLQRRRTLIWDGSPPDIPSSPLLPSSEDEQ